MNEIKKINNMKEAYNELYALGLTTKEIKLLKEKLFMKFVSEVRYSFYFEVDTCKLMNSCKINPEGHSDHRQADQSEDENEAEK